jgi:dipeptidyl aminopeptidase/acylaminoacyl peptidase
MATNFKRIAIFLSIVVAAHVAAQQPYQHPPREIVEILDAPPPPVPFVSPAGNALILATPVQYRPISDLAEPMLHGAGTRINPRNNGPHLFVYYVGFQLQHLPDGAEVAIALPAGARVTEPRWNASGSMFAFSSITATSVELWVGDAATANVHRVDGVRLNPVLGYTLNWMPDQKTLLVKTVPAQRGAPPAETAVPAGPRVEDSTGVNYQRPDGVKLSFTLYLPPGYRKGTRLPTVLWAYPLDFTDPGAAGQVTTAPQKFTSVWGPSPIFLALEGYAVLDDAAMPVVGPRETAYDTFIEQIVANAKAAIDKAVELGVTDRDRVGVFGHSHGALMTANLLAWSDLFRAGVARSGAYNHTLRPFGFQFERRTLYQAPDTYLKLSPLLHADRIKTPLLLIHGERDNNPGTVPLQSEKLFEAIRGTGGTARLVMLPMEPHVYLARESVEQTLYETLTWFDRYVKNAPPRGKPATAPTGGE